MKKYRKGVFIVAYKIIKNKPKYLLLKRKLHWKGWEFPKGGKEPKESNLETIHRELKEETNLNPIKINKHNLKGKYKYTNKIERPYIGQTFTLYSVKVQNQKVIIDKREHSSYKWLDFKKAREFLTWDNQKKSLEIVNNSL